MCVSAVMYCPFCGQEQKADQRFCSNCGGDLTQAQPSGPSPGSTSTQAPPHVSQGRPSPFAGGEGVRSDAELASARNFAYAGIALAVIGFFIAGPILGIGAIILGYMAKQKGENNLGMVAMAAGTVIFLVSSFFVMLVGW